MTRRIVEWFVWAIIVNIVAWLLGVDLNLPIIILCTVASVVSGLIWAYRP